MALHYLSMPGLTDEAARAFLREKGLFPKEVRFLLRRSQRTRTRRQRLFPAENYAA